MNTPQKINIIPGKKVIYAMAIAGILSFTYTDAYSQTTPKQTPKLGVAPTKRTAEEMIKRIARYLTKEEGRALDESGLMDDPKCVKRVDRFIAMHEDGLMGSGRVIACVFYMANQKKPNLILQKYINELGKDRVKEIVDDAFEADLLYIKE